MVEIGSVALFLALIAAIFAVIAFVLGKRGENLALLKSARSSVLVICGLLTISVSALLYALITHNFQLEYVASYTSSDLPLGYIISALWAGNDGSLLFWAWLLSIFAAIAVMQKREVGRDLVPYASAIMMFTQAFFIMLVIFVANPFRSLDFVPAEGRGLNPLLENPGMFFHPPFLLAGYIGFTVPFAFAMAALIMRRSGDEWIPVIRRWTLIAWLFLSVGNILGAWWAYVELGWGGYWAWDPVENASLLPWLVSTAFLHSIMMQRRRGILKVWNMALITITFTLSILGTFLTRSGVLASVHSFGESPLLGSLFLAFIGVTLFGSLGLLYYRSDELRSEAEMESIVSRESTFLLNNLLLVGAAFATFLGTFFPVISEAVRGVKITVGPPFFNQINGPIFMAIIILSGICALIGWRRASVRNLKMNFLYPFALALVLGTVLFVLGIHKWVALLGFTICGFVLFTILYEWFRGVRARHKMRNENYFQAFWKLVMANRPRYGGYVVHIGVLLFAIGVIGSSFYVVEQEVSIKQGESINIGRYILTYNSIDQFETQSKDIVAVNFSVYNAGHFLGTLLPEKVMHKSYDQSVTNVAIRSTLADDLYLILIGEDKDDTMAFKALVTPLVAWLWIGGTIVVFGGLLAFWPDNRRPLIKRNSEGLTE